MSEDTKYNGWTNYETWLINMYVTGNYTGEGTSRHYDQVAQGTFEDAEGDAFSSKSQIARYELSEHLKDEFDELRFAEDIPVNGSIVSDLLKASIDRVDWWTIADGLLDPVDGYEPS